MPLGHGDASQMGEKSGTRRSEKLDLVSAVSTLLGVLGLSTILVVLSLQTASGITYLGGTSYQTEFANPAWWIAGFLLFIPVCVASWRHPRLAPGYVIAALGPQVVLPAVVVHRYAVTGWDDGLEALGYLYPILMLPLFFAAAALGSVLGKRRQRTEDA
jgi:hypothetical protein